MENFLPKRKTKTTKRNEKMINYKREKVINYLSEKVINYKNEK